VSVSLGAPLGDPGRGEPAIGNLAHSLKEGAGCGSSFSLGALLGEPGGGSIARGPEGYERKALGKGISLHGGSVGQRGVGSSSRDFEIWLKGALKVGRLPLWELCERNLEGGLPCWGP
jgi:hypothetical protein